MAGNRIRGITVEIGSDTTKLQTGHVPYGLMKDPKDKHKLIIDPEVAAVVREIFGMAIAKMRLIDMARTLNERGVETPGQYYKRKHPGTKKFTNSSDKAC